MNKVNIRMEPASNKKKENEEEILLNYLSHNYIF